MRSWIRPTRSSQRRRRSRVGRCCALAATLVTAAGLVAGAATSQQSTTSSIGYIGPIAWLLHDSTDLGPANDRQVGVVLALRRGQQPTHLLGWARTHDVQVDWHPGADWAGVSGPAAAMSSAFHVPVHDFRSRTGQRFYAANRPVIIPTPLSREVTGVGRMLDYHVRSLAPARPLADVPPNGLNPRQLITAYGANALNAAGYTGSGSTVVFFEWTPPTQSDLDAFTTSAGLPPLTPTIVGGNGSSDWGGPSDGEVETEMDLEIVHAIAPKARLVVVNANASSQATTVGQGIAALFTQTEAQFPGAVWSSSIGWGCNRVLTATDLRPAEQALEAAEARGTTAFDASGDTAGLECKGQPNDYSAPPNESDVGVDAVASMPAMTSVGGTTLSTDANGNWAAEQTWISSSASNGTGGGVVPDQPRPSWQQAKGVDSSGDTTHRLVPDIAADADPSTGVATYLQGQPSDGGGTSQAAPIWAGLATLMDEYLTKQGGHLIGAINPLLYRIARGAQRPAFHDVTLGGNAVASAGPGYDPVTGLGTPNTENLAGDLLDVQKGTS